MKNIIIYKNKQYLYNLILNFNDFIKIIINKNIKMYKFHN